MLLFVMLLVCVIGYLAQSIGLCMVRGVNELKKGKPEFLISVLLSGVLTWVAILFASYVGIPTSFKMYEVNIWFAFGGFIFGIGSAFNQGCGVSTLSKLSRGDSKMIFTISGWLLGWAIIAVWGPTTNHNKLNTSPAITIGVLIVLSITLLVWAFKGNKERRTLWLTMMSIGLIGGFVFLFEPKWPPSGLLYKISHAIASSEINLWPAKESYYIFISLLLGMFSAAWKAKKFGVIKSTWSEWLIHIIAGSLMGVGASLALGGNDSQLLLALPTFSPGGGIAVLGMLIGIWIGLSVRDKLLVKT